MSLTQMILFVIFSLYLTKFGEFCEMMVASGSILLTLFNNKQGKKGTTNAPNGSNGRFAAGGKGMRLL